MSHVDTLVIGAGQAGLALSHELTTRGHDHVVLERHEVGARWRRQSWDSLRLLTPNWLNVLPGGEPTGVDPDGFAAAGDVATHLDRYAASFAAPVEAGVAVESVRSCPSGGFAVATSSGHWHATNVVVATGWCDQANVPAVGARLDVDQLTADVYRRPADLPPGGVLVVGASATGVQLAAELRAAGRDVTLAIGRHTRLPRTYRGMDVFWWLQRLGALDRTIESMPDPAAARQEPSLQLVGRHGAADVGLAALQAAGVRLTGRLVDGCGSSVRVDGGAAARIADAERRLDSLLARIDDHIERAGLGGEVLSAAPRSSVRPFGEPAALDLRRAGITSVLWATGHRRTYPWLDVPVLGDDGEIVHRRGITTVPGLLALGLRFQHRRSSNFLGGVGADASFLADHLTTSSPTGAPHEDLLIR